MNTNIFLALLCLAVALLIPLWLLLQLKLKKPYKAKQHKVSKVLTKSKIYNDDVLQPINQNEMKIKNNKRRANPWDKQSSDRKISNVGSSSKGSQIKDSPKYNQLLGMLNGDRGIADRLINTYGLDKAIDDLIRDRQ